MTWNGILYIMDKQRMILEESEQEDLVISAGEGDAAGLQAGGAQNADPEEAELREELSRLVKVDGLKIRSGAMTGQVLQMENKDQQVVFSELFLQMKVLSCTELIAEADLSNLGSLLLTTRDGFTVSMGGSENIHAKLRSMLLTREELLRMGYRGGVINVMLPETPIYSPPGS